MIGTLEKKYKKIFGFLYHFRNGSCLNNSNFAPHFLGKNPFQPRKIKEVLHVGR